MRLYRMELYKLYHNKIFRIGLFAATALLLAYFWFAEVGGEIAAVDGSVYSGYEAVKMNKKITKEFEGELTDEKVHQIVEKYGLPSKLEENMPGWRDGNFLNDFVTRYFTNGAWENGITPTERYMIAETELGENCEKLGITPYLTYTTGWKIFVEMLQFGLILGSILVICSVLTIFAEESQTKMLPLIFSTEEGRRKDVMAKIAAALTFTISIFLWFAVINLALCQVVFKISGSLTHACIGSLIIIVCYYPVCICPSEQFIWSRHYLCSMLGPAGDNKNIFRRLYGPYRRCHASIPDYDKHGQRHL